MVKREAFGRTLPPRTVSPQIITYWANTPYSLSITQITILTSPVLQPAGYNTILTGRSATHKITNQFHTLDSLGFFFKIILTKDCGRGVVGVRWLSSHSMTDENITSQF